MPHLQYSQDVTQFDFVLSDINTGSITKARYAIEAVMFSTDPNQVDMKIDKTKSIDDEYSPGVFTVSILFPSFNYSYYTITNRVTNKGKDYVYLPIQFSPTYFFHPAPLPFPSYFSHLATLPFPSHFSHPISPLFSTTFPILFLPHYSTTTATTTATTTESVDGSKYFVDFFHPINTTQSTATITIVVAK